MKEWVCNHISGLLVGGVLSPGHAWFSCTRWSLSP